MSGKEDYQGTNSARPLAVALVGLFRCTFFLFEKERSYAPMQVTFFNGNAPVKCHAFFSVYDF